ncbi:MAG TPA: winged helix-turn-helix domain-containing protein [Pyrinomonadaceae bacterium]|nr:winged helix-turn-helix domain-containing protein [Pyrinomonadaceae bacterium]
MSKRLHHFYEFGPFRLDLNEYLLLQDDEPVPLPPKVFETLMILVERSGRVVSKEEMIETLWPDRYVEESNLTQNIFMLRKALGEGQKSQYIETVPKRGYRFVAPVKEIIEESEDRAAERPVAAREAGPEEKAAARREEAVTTLAVLPMVNESGDPELEYLADGITESIINSLSRLRQVHIIARSVAFSYKGRDADALMVGRELMADAVLVSRVLVQGGVFIIQAEMVEAATGWQVWGGRYNLPPSDIQMAQDVVSARITEGLRLRLTEEERRRLGKHYTVNPEAYQFYLKARYYWNRRSVEGYQKAIEYFQEATRLDPGYALAYSGLADTYVAFDFYGILPPWETSPKAKTAAINALLIDDTLAEAHTSLACVKMMYERDWSNAEREFRRAIEVDPNYAHAHNWHSHFLMAMGRIEESLAESRLALKLDPLNDSINQYLGWHYIHARQFARAISQLEKCLELNPDFFLARVTLGMAYEQNGEFVKAVEEFEKARLIYDSPLLLGFLGHAYAMKGEREAAVEALRELEQASARTYIPPYCIALIYTALGEKQHAFEWFEKAYAAQNEWLNWIKVAPEVDSLRSEPQFGSLLRRLNLVDDQ